MTELGGGGGNDDEQPPPPLASAAAAANKCAEPVTPDRRDAYDANGRAGAFAALPSSLNDEVKNAAAERAPAVRGAVVVANNGVDGVGVGGDGGTASVAMLTVGTASGGRLQLVVWSRGSGDCGAHAGLPVLAVLRARDAMTSRLPFDHNARQCRRNYL